MKCLSTTLLTVSLLLLPVAIVIEHNYLSTWNNRLAIPEFESKTNRHTPKHFVGTFLPPRINKDTTLSMDDNPVILAFSTQIEPGVTLAIEPGVHIYANENTNLIISGQLLARGVKDKPIIFSSNEDHPLNQTWLGISVTSGGSATLEQVSIEDSSPAISCLEGSKVKATNTRLTRGVLGVFQASANCQLANMFINGVRNGVIIINEEPQITSTTINSKKDKIMTVSLP